MASSLVEWTDPAPETVAPGIHRINLPLPNDGLRAVNIYLIETERDLVCIDGGWALEVARAQLDGAMRTLGHQPGDIRRFLVTHHHRDHYTMAAALREEFEVAEVSLGEHERPTMEIFNGDRDHSDMTYKRLVRADAAPLAEQWREWTSTSVQTYDHYAYPDHWLRHEQIIDLGERQLRVIHTPGHTAGHVVFLDEAAGLLFAGDHVLPRITPSISFELLPGANPLGDYLGSLEVVRALPDTKLLGAHGPVAPSTNARIDELLAHHDARLEDCRAAVQAGKQTVHQVAATLGWTRRETPLAKLDGFNQTMAVIETMVHLDLLTFRGTLQVRADTSPHGAQIARYRITA